MIKDLFWKISEGVDLDADEEKVLGVVSKAAEDYEAMIAARAAAEESAEAALNLLDSFDDDEDDDEDEPEDVEAPEPVAPEPVDAFEEPEEVEEEDEDDEPVSAEPIEMTQPAAEDEFEPVGTRDGLPVYGIGQMPKRLITRSDLAEAAGLSPSGLSWHIKHHPEHPKPVAMLLTAGGGIPSLLFDRATTNTYWQTRKEH